MRSELNLEIFFKGYRFLYFAKNVGKNKSKNISENLRGKYTQKPLTYAHKTASKRAFRKEQRQLVI